MHLKVYRRDNRKKDEGRWRRAFLRASAALGVVLLGLVAYSVSGPRMIVASSLRELSLDRPSRAVREIQVRGADKVGGQEVVAMAALRGGMSIWCSDLAASEKKTGRDPWVRRVCVRRECPRRVIIDVE